MTEEKHYENLKASFYAPYETKDYYTSSTIFERIPDSKNERLAPIQTIEPVTGNGKVTKDALVRIYSRHEHRGQTLMLAFNVVISPIVQTGEKIYESPDPLIHRGYKMCGGEHMLPLSTKVGELKVSLVAYRYPKKLCILDEDGMPIFHKKYYTATLLKDHSIESEFTFIFEELDETKLSHFCIKAAFNVEHDTNPLTCETSFFLDSNQDPQKVGSEKKKSYSNNNRMKQAKNNPSPLFTAEAALRNKIHNTDDDNSTTADDNNDIKRHDSYDSSIETLKSDSASD